MSILQQARVLITSVPYAAFLLWPTIYLYYAIYLYQPYVVFLARLPIYILINLIIYGLSYLLTGSKERATLGSAVFFITNLVLIRSGTQLPLLRTLHEVWNVHPEALAIPLLTLPLLRLIQIGQRVAHFIHLSVLSMIILLHARLSIREVRNHFYLHKPSPTACPEAALQDSTFRYPDIYCLVFDAFGEPDTLERYLHLSFSYPDSLLQKGFLLSSLSLSYNATIYALYYFSSPDKLPLSPPELESYINQKRAYDIIAYSSLPQVLREKGYYLTGPLPMYYNLQSMPCFHFHSYYNIFGMSFPYNSRWSTYAWHSITFATSMSISRQSRPVFYYYHLLTSHWPYVFDADGRYLRNREDNLNTLRASFTYTEKVLLQVVSDIQRDRRGNPRPYAILIFSDHGPYELEGPPYHLPPDTAQRIARSAIAALYTSWTLPDSTREAFLKATNHHDLGRIILQIANPIKRQVSPLSPSPETL
jgi:hypothetical protein